MSSCQIDRSSMTVLQPSEDFGYTLVHISQKRDYTKRWSIIKDKQWKEQCKWILNRNSNISIFIRSFSTRRWKTGYLLCITVHSVFACAAFSLIAFDHAQFLSCIDTQQLTSVLTSGWEWSNKDPNSRISIQYSLALLFPLITKEGLLIRLFVTLLRKNI